MKLAIIGNSHIGSLKRGWDKISASHAGIEPVFFGARQQGLRHLRVQGKELVPTEDWVRDSIRFTSGGQESISLTEFDSILIYACAAPAFFLAEGSFYSQQAFRRTMDGFRQRLYFHLASRARKLTDRPIWIGHTPLPAAEKRTSADVGDYIRGMQFINKMHFEPMGTYAISQPADTIVNGRATDIKYSQGSRSLAVGDAVDDALHAATDTLHMNDEFGALWLQEFFDGLKTESRVGRAIVSS